MLHDPNESLGELVDRSHLMDPSKFTDEVSAAAAHLGATDLEIYLTDYEQRMLMPLRVTAGGEPLTIETTLAGRSFVSGEPQLSEQDSCVRTWVPLLDGADRLGVLRFDMETVDDKAITAMMRFAGLMAQLIVTKSRYSDVFDRAAQRVTPSVAAHVQWSQLPPMTFTTPRVAIAGILEPAYDIGGDAFDYSHNDDRTDIVMLDAMGHGLTACWPATLAMAGLRHARQRGLGLAERYDECSRLLARELSAYEFVAAQLAELDSTTGLLRWVTAGLPRPLLVRRGKVIGELPSPANLPLGVAVDGGGAQIASFSLEPWDRVLFFTDGVIEGHRPGNEPFGIERLVDLLGRESLALAGPAEAVRRVAHAVLDHNNHDLRDDFTMLIVEYRGGGADVEAVPHSYRLPGHRTV